MRFWLWVSILLLAGCEQPLRAPKTFVPFSAKDKAFSGERPESWRMLAAVGKDAMSAVSLSHYEARLGITAEPRNLALSLDALHRSRQSRAATDLAHYQEQSAQPLETKLGRGLLTEFTGEHLAPMGSSPVHGYRATITTGTQEISVVARCWDSDWATLGPAFYRVIESLAPGFVSTY